MASALRRLGLTAVATAAVGSTLLLPAQAIAASPSAGSPTLSAPTLSSPASDTTESSPIKDVTLSWQAVAGAASYQVEISANSSFTNNTVVLPDGGDTVNTSYDVPISLPHGSWFWRVRAVGARGSGTWSAPREFLHEWDANTTPSGTFSMLQSPTDNPLFSWTPVPEASLYEVRVSTDPGFSADADTHNCWTAATSLYPYDSASREASVGAGCFSQGDLTPGKTYYWLVRPYDDSTAATVQSDLSNDASWECASVQPECDAVTQRGSFTFTPPAYDATDVTGTPTGLTTSYHTASGSTDCTNFADGSSPAGNSCPTTPTFSWNPVPHANFYRVHIYTDPDETNTLRSYTTPYTSLTPRDLILDDQDAGAYYWTVEAGYCVHSAQDLNCAAPQTPPTPACATGNGASTPVINDANVGGATVVEGGIQVTVTLSGSGLNPSCVTSSDGQTIGSDDITGNANTIQFSYVTPFGTDKQKVSFTVTNQDGAASGSSPDITVLAKPLKEFDTVSQVAGFRIDTGAVTLSAPADGTTSKERDLAFSWTDYLNSGGQGAAEARNYDLQVATDPNFDHVVFDDPNIDFTHFVDPAGSLASGDYYWRVGPIDEVGDLLHWSATRQITVDDTPPSVSLATKAGIAVNGTWAITSSEPLQGVTTGADSPSFQLVSAAGDVVSGTVTSVDSTHWTVKPSSLLVTGETYSLQLGSGLTDSVGNPAVVSGSAVRTTTVADDGSAGWTYQGHWAKGSMSKAKGGTFRSAGKGASATVTVAGTKVTLYACKAPKFGTETVTLDGKRVATLSMSHSFTECGVAVWSGSLKKGDHTLKVSVTKGTGDIDEVTVA